MNDTRAFNIETLQCGTNADGSAVVLVLSGSAFQHRYSLPIHALGIFIEQLLKMHNTARAHAVLTAAARDASDRTIRPVLETFLVDDVTVVASESGPVTVRIVSSDGSRDIVFPPAQWQFLRSPLVEGDADNGGATEH